MNDNKINRRGGARLNSGRKQGIGITNDIKKYCFMMIEEMLKNEAIRIKTTKQLSLFYETKNNYLYIIKSGYGYKIGYSSNWKKRSRQYDTHTNGYELIYLIEHPDSFQFEEYLHKMFQNKQIKGEWFKLNTQDLIDAISYCSNKILY